MKTKHLMRFVLLVGSVFIFGELLAPRAVVATNYQDIAACMADGGIPVEAGGCANHTPSYPLKGSIISPMGDCCGPAPAAAPAAAPSTETGFTYTPIENIPGSERTTTFPGYVSGIYKFGIWSVGIAAMFMLTLGGFMYMTSAGNTAALGRAKEVIKDSIIGLVLALFAWFILNIINPDLVNVNLSKFSQVGGVAPPKTESGGPGSPKPGATCTTTTSDAAPITTDMKDKAQQILDKVSMNSSGDCKGAGGVSISPKYNFQQVARGDAMTKCFDGCRSIAKCGGSYCSATTSMSAAAMDVILKTQAETENVIGINRFQIFSVAGGDHSPDSNHYHGRAIDVGLTMNNLGWGPTLAAFIRNGAANDNGTRTGSFCEAASGAYVNCLGKGSGPRTEVMTNHLHVKLP